MSLQMSMMGKMKKKKKKYTIPFLLIALCPRHGVTLTFGTTWKKTFQNQKCFPKKEKENIYKHKFNKLSQRKGTM